MPRTATQNLPAPQTVMVVEGSELTLRLLHDLFSAEGYLFVSTGDKTRAIALADEHRPDLILVDMHPLETELTIIRQLKDIPDLQPIPVVAVVTRGESSEARTVRKAGCEASIEKPIVTDQLFSTIRQLIGQSILSPRH